MAKKNRVKFITYGVEINGTNDTMVTRIYIEIILFTKDRDDTMRVTGEEWLVKKIGAYLPGAYEEVIDTVGAYVLNDKVCA